MRHLLCTVALCAIASPAFAQGVAPHDSNLSPSSANPSPPNVAAPSQGPLQVAAPPVGNAVLRTGVTVPLRLLDPLTTKEKALRPGQRFHLETAEPVLVQGITVIPTGTPAEGEIVDVRNKGMWGKSGKFNARLLFLTLNGRQIRLSGTFDDKGHAGGVAATAVSALVFLPAGFFMTGHSANLPAGTAVTGYIDEDIPLNLPAVPQSAVLTIPAQPSSAATPPSPAPVAPAKQALPTPAATAH